MVLYILSLILAVIGVAGAVIPVIPGLLVSYAALLAGYFSERDVVSQEWLVGWLIIVVIISIIDYIMPIYFSKLLGGSKSGVRGATIGMIAGFIFFPPLGIILCPFCGAVIGELMNDRNDVARSFKVGFSSFIAFLLGSGIKLIVSIWILLQIVAKIYI